MSDPLTPEQLRERVLALVDERLAAGDDTERDLVLLVFRAYAAGWRDAGGDFDPLTMLEAGFA